VRGETGGAAESGDGAVTDWRDVDWSQTLGGNDRFGDCTFVSLANLIDIIKAPQIVSEGETERFYTVETNWTAENPGSDKGAVLETVIQDWCANGWPSDPVLRPSGYHAITFDQVADALARTDGVPAWLMLPSNADGSGYDFTDDALDAEGRYAHAVLIVSFDPFIFVTWAQPQAVSEAWARRFFMGFYEVDWSAEA
jgi:hypothetical protein